jgi:hypothetical protein
MKAIIKKTGSEFKILQSTNAIYIAEQFIDSKLVSIEVGGLKVARGYDGNSPAYFSIPSGSSFGMGVHDKSFPKRLVNEAWDYFNSIKDNARPPKDWEDVLN